MGAWYEAMTIMSKNDKQAQNAIKFMAKQAGGTLSEFKKQIETTFMYYDPADAAAFARSDELKHTMEYVRQFCFKQGLFKGARNVDYVGIQFPDGDVIGSATNVMLRFDATFMEMAARGEL